MVKIQPVGNRVIVQAVKAEEKTAGGLYMPDSAQEKESQGTIVACGTLHGVDVKVGDTIIYADFKATNVTIDGGNYSIVGAEDILAIVKE